MKRQLTLNQDGTVSHIIQDDVALDLAIAKDMRDNAPIRGQRFTKDFTHCARIPEAIAAKIHAEKGISFFRKEDLPAFWAVIKSDYPNFLTMPGNVLTGKSKRGRD